MIGEDHGEDKTGSIDPKQRTLVPPSAPPQGTGAVASSTPAKSSDEAEDLHVILHLGSKWFHSAEPILRRILNSDPAPETRPFRRLTAGAGAGTPVEEVVEVTAERVGGGVPWGRPKPPE